MVTNRLAQSDVGSLGEDPFSRVLREEMIMYYGLEKGRCEMEKSVLPQL